MRKIQTTFKNKLLEALIISLIFNILLVLQRGCDSEGNSFFLKRSTFNQMITAFWLGLTAHLQNFSSYELVTSFTLNPKLILVVPLTVGNTIPEGQTTSDLTFTKTVGQSLKCECIFTCWCILRITLCDRFYTWSSQGATDPPGLKELVRSWCLCHSQSNL